MVCMTALQKNEWIWNVKFAMQIWWRRWFGSGTWMEKRFPACHNNIVIITVTSLPLTFSRLTHHFCVLRRTLKDWLNNIQSEAAYQCHYSTVQNGSFSTDDNKEAGTTAVCTKISDSSHNTLHLSWTTLQLHLHSRNLCNQLWRNLVSFLLSTNKETC